MKTLIIIILHFAINIGFGLAVLKLLGNAKISILEVLQAFVIGMLFESSFGFLCLYLHLQEYCSLIFIGVVGISYLLFYKLKKKDLGFSFETSLFKNLKYFEVGLLLLILHKVIISIYSLIKLPLYFDDAMTHWSGRARAIYGDVNWSMVLSPNFLGKQLGYKEYPLFSSVWRANTAHMNGHWNDIVSRGDGLMFFIILLLSVYLVVRHLKGPKWLALAAVFITSSFPLQFYHVTSGYSEITIQGLSILCLLTLYKRQWKVLGFLVGAMIFTKNEGLMLYFPLFTLLTIFSLLFSKLNLMSKIKSFTYYIFCSLALVAHWLVFKLSAGVAFSTPLKAEPYYHKGSLNLFADFMFNSASSSIFWIFFVVIVLINVPKIFKSFELSALLMLLSLIIAAFIYIFCFTGANIFLVNQMTIHRSLLQIAPLAVVLAMGLMAKEVTT